MTNPEVRGTDRFHTLDLVTFGNDKSFVGRVEILDRLRQALDKPEHSDVREYTRVALSGLGGIGYVILQYAP